jgi:CRISPR/Cas system-associated exonuclease Cas4 (RecB family)
MTRPVLSLLRAEEHISVSALNTYLLCPAQYEHRYILRTPPSHRSGALAFGGSIHTALALFYSRLMDGQPEPTVEELEGSFSDAWTRELQGDIPVLLDEKDTPDSARDHGVKLLQVFHEQAPRPHKVIGVEEAFSVEIKDPRTGVAFVERLVGVFDAVGQDTDGAYQIVEHKTSSRRYAQTRLDHDLQVTAYTLAAPLVGLPNAGVTLQVLLKQKSPALELHPLTRTDRDRRDLLQVLSGVLCAIKVGAFYPVRDWPCQSCPFSGPCLAG